MKRPDTVLVLLAAYFAVMFGIRHIIPDGLRYDEAQQAFFSQWIVAGYDSQPPLYNWVQAAFVAVFGLSITSLAFVKAVALFAAYASYYRLAREVLTERLFAVIATLSLMTIPQIFWEAQRDLTHSVALVICINLFLLVVIRTLKAPTTLLYASLGLIAGLGMISKYNFALIFLGTFVAVLANPQWRVRLYDPRILLSCLIGLLVVLPHGLWLLDNFGVASNKTLTIMGQDAPDEALLKFVQGPIRFFRITVIILAPLALVYLLVFRSNLLRSLRASTDWTRLFGWIFVTIILTVLILIVTIGMTALRDRWLMPFVALVPLFLCLKLEALKVQSHDFLGRFLVFPLTVMLLVPLALTLRTNAPQLFGSYQAYNMPYGDLMEHILAEEGRKPGLIQTTNWMVAGNSHLQTPDIPVMATSLEALQLPYAWSDENPMLLIWLRSEGDTIPPSISAWLERAAPVHRLSGPRSIERPYQHSFNDETAALGYAWVYPPSP
ncbi:glycosyltransferase family 39 protein [Peteryoungia ipomoeae]|nr:glycosyltransferase family 39 protein [Peteryoungia ipomoeae]